MTDPNNYCVYLNNWAYINNTGRLGMCCKNNWTSVTPPFQTIVNTPLSELWTNAHLMYQIDSMKQGNVPRGCNICYDAEKNVDVLNSFRNRSLRALTQQKTKLQPFDDRKIRALDLRVGSTCNLACVMCHPSDSSKWFSIYEDFHTAMQFDTDNRLTNVKKQYKPSQLNWAEHDSSWENIFNSIDTDLYKIYMAGGEPFYIKKFPEYVTELVERVPNAIIDINTNGTCSLSEKHLNKLAGKLNLRISIDGFEKSEEYQRLGTTWEDKVAVIDQYVKHFNVKVFDLTITSLTVRQVPDLVKFLIDRYSNTEIMLRPVVNREGLALNDIPMEMRQNTINFLDDLLGKKLAMFHNGEQFLHHLNLPYRDGTKPVLQRTMNHWDKICSVKLSDYDEELAKWITK